MVIFQLLFPCGPRDRGLLCVLTALTPLRPDVALVITVFSIFCSSMLYSLVLLSYLLLDLMLPPSGLLFLFFFLSQEMVSVPCYTDSLCSLFLVLILIYFLITCFFFSPLFVLSPLSMCCLSFSIFAWTEQTLVLRLINFAFPFSPYCYDAT